MPTIQQSKPRTAQPHLEAGAAQELGVKPALLINALRREGWGPRMLTIAQAHEWANNVETAPPRVRGLILHAQNREDAHKLMPHEVAGVLRARSGEITRRAHKAGHTEYITTKAARAWVANPAAAPAWVRDLLRERDERLERRAAAETRREAHEAAGQEIEHNGAAQQILDESPLRPEHLEASADIHWQALSVLNQSQSTSTRWLDELELEALKLQGIDPTDRSTWPFPIRTDEVPGTNLLRQLVGPTGLECHILTAVAPNGDSVSTAVHIDEDGVLEIEYPIVIRTLEDALSEGLAAPIILRSFDDSRHDELRTDIKIPVKVLRSWRIADGAIEPVPASAMFAAACTDAATGEPLPPEAATEYADSWDLWDLQPE